MVENSFLNGAFVKPRLGRRRCSGIWPPSNPRFWLKPVPACWPLWPRVEVLPMPEPIPRPTRLRRVVCPAGGLTLLRFISLFHHLEQMRNLLHHPAKHRRIRPFHHLVELAQTEALHHGLLLLRSANRAADEFDFDFVSHSN